MATDRTLEANREIGRRVLEEIWGTGLARFSATGTHRAEFLGAAPTGRRIGYAGIDVNRIRDGRIVESWVHYDALGLLEQLGLVPSVEGM